MFVIRLVLVLMVCVIFNFGCKSKMIINTIVKNNTNQNETFLIQNNIQQKIDIKKIKDQYKNDKFFFYYRLPTLEDQSEGLFLRFYYREVSNGKIEGILVYQSNVLGSIKFNDLSVGNAIASETVDSLRDKDSEYINSLQFFKVLDRYDSCIFMLSGSIENNKIQFTTKSVKLDDIYYLHFDFDGAINNGLIEGKLTDTATYIAVDFGDKTTITTLNVSSKIYKRAD